MEFAGTEMTFQLEFSCLHVTKPNFISFSDLDFFFPQDNTDRTQVLSVTQKTQFATGSQVWLWAYSAASGLSFP